MDFDVLQPMALGTEHVSSILGIFDVLVSISFVSQDI